MDLIKIKKLIIKLYIHNYNTTIKQEEFNKFCNYISKKYKISIKEANKIVNNLSDIFKV
jgi:hypothetical protein